MASTSSASTAFTDAGYLSSYSNRHLTPEGIAAIKPNQENSLAVHCHQTTGGQYIDVGFIERIPVTK